MGGRFICCFRAWEVRVVGLSLGAAITLVACVAVQSITGVSSSSASPGDGGGARGSSTEAALASNWFGLTLGDLFSSIFLAPETVRCTSQDCFFCLYAFSFSDTAAHSSLTGSGSGPGGGIQIPRQTSRLSLSHLCRWLTLLLCSCG